MSSPLRFRFILKDLNVRRLWSVWTRCHFVSSVVKRCKRERGVREVINCFRQTILRSRRTLLLSATAAYKSHLDDDDTQSGCDRNITDEELQALVAELEGVEELSKLTLFCTSCGKRLVIDKKHSGVTYCICKDTCPSEESSDGWVPYMEAEDVIIWRKEYKPGQGLYAYKVYGRYKDVKAQDFAAVNIDGAYRRVWDAAVASLSVVERHANGVRDQAVLHWEVLWPRLFANRDYVYIRRHKEFNVKSQRLSHKDSIFNGDTTSNPEQYYEERPSVHSKAKRKSMEEYRRLSNITQKDNKVYIIVSRSCEHPKVPETKHAIRVFEYWSHMVVKSLDGEDKPGMEFVLTYYDEPGVGGMPSGVAAWASSRAAPAYLLKMRQAAANYRAWLATREEQDLPDFTASGPDNVSYSEKETSTVRVREQDMESFKEGPELNGEVSTKDKSTQTDKRVPNQNEPVQVKIDDSKDKNDDAPKDSKKEQPHVSEGDGDKPEEEESNGSWWRYLYPFYYFV